MKQLLCLLGLLFSASLFAASPSFQSFDTNQFGVAGNTVAVVGSPIVLRKSDGSFTNFAASTGTARAVALTNAQSSASALDTIYASGPISLPTGATNTLGKAGVRYWFSPGTYIEKPDSIVSDKSATMNLFLDGGAMLAMTNTVSADYAVKITGATSSGIANLYSVTNLGPSGAGGINLNSASGRFTFNIADTIYSSNYDAVVVDAGELAINASKLIGGDNGVELSGGRSWISAKQISGGGIGLNITGGTNFINADAILSVGQNVFLATTPMETTVVAGKMTGGIWYRSGVVRIVNCKIEGTVRVNAPVGFVLENCTIDSTDALAITSAVPATVTIIGTLNLNGKGIHTNITLVGTNYIPNLVRVGTNVSNLLVPTNFISGWVYSNTYGNTIEVSANVCQTLQGTSVSGIELRVPGWRTNYATTATDASGPMTNYIAIKVPVGFSYTFTNVSTGAGGATLRNGEVYVY